MQATVLDFGAIGDGIADDSAAIQRAVDSAVGQVYFPKGVYRITKTIQIDLNKFGVSALRGEAVARIVMAGPGPALLIAGTHTGTASPSTVKQEVWQRQRTPTVDGLEIVGAHPQACGIEATKTMQLTLTRLTVRQALHGIQLTQRNRNVIISACHLYDNNGIGIYLDRVNLHQINLTNCHISYNDGGGVVAHRVRYVICK